MPDRTNRPLLLYKVGVLGATPLDFMESLASALSPDTCFVSSHREQKRILDASVRSTVAVREARPGLAAAAKDALAGGDDIVVDEFFNSANTRRVPAGWAQPLGGRTIALSIATPYALAKERITQLVEDDGFELPVAAWEVPPKMMFRFMKGQVERPRQEGIDTVVRLDGTADTPGLVAQTVHYLGSRGVLEA